MTRIDIDLEDYLDEVDTRYLVRELSKRKDRVKYKVELEEFVELTGIDRDYFEFKNSGKLLRYIKKLLGLREWHDKDRVIAEIKEL